MTNMISLAEDFKALGVIFREAYWVGEIKLPGMSTHPYLCAPFLPTRPSCISGRARQSFSQNVLSAPNVFFVVLWWVGVGIDLPPPSTSFPKHLWLWTKPFMPPSIFSPVFLKCVLAQRFVKIKCAVELFQRKIIGNDNFQGISLEGKVIFFNHQMDTLRGGVLGFLWGGSYTYIVVIGCNAPQPLLPSS